MEAGALYRLLAWSSPSYPVGAYVYSHGLEYAVECGLVAGADDLGRWIEGILAQGAGRIDGAFLVAAWRAATAGDFAVLDAVAELALAWRGGAELALESAAQGSAFLAVTCRAWPEPRLAAASERWQGRAALPVAVGLAAACHGVPLREMLAAQLASLAANLISAAIRLMPLGQTAGQMLLAGLAPAIDRAAAAALASDLDTLGSAAPMVDWCSFRHETQETRLFRS
jgi:urease accessory protein